MTEAHTTTPHPSVREEEGLDLLHPDRVRSGAAIRQLLTRVSRERILLRQAMNKKILPELATIEQVGPVDLVLRTQNFEKNPESVSLSFELDGGPFYFLSRVLAEESSNRLRIESPKTIYRRERRGRLRHMPSTGDPRWVEVNFDLGTTEAEILDESPSGLALAVRESDAHHLERAVRVRFMDGPSAGDEFYGEVRHRSKWQREGWLKLGLDVSAAPRNATFVSDRRKGIISLTAREKVLRNLKIASAGLRVATLRTRRALGRTTSAPEVRVIDYENQQGESIRAIIDHCGDTQGAPVVIIPPAWGRTKETLMPLAATLVEGFRAAGEPLVVVRFDGVRKRGESHNEPQCQAPGTEHHRFTFSQGVRDIRASLDFLESSPAYRPKRTILISFSAASIEARRATASDPRIAGWISVVGAPDVQSMMRVISGGIDFGIGLEQGVGFGMFEILGVTVDMDHAAQDALREGFMYLEDSRRDMAAIKAPVTWIHGLHDAWMDDDRTQDILSRGSIGNRKFVAVPTGHMLRTSREALEVFQLITREASQMLLGREIEAKVPDLTALERRQHAERARLTTAPSDRRAFWRDYLVGKNRQIGIELFTSVSAYRDLMKRQIEALSLEESQTILDLGSGTGSFPIELAGSSCQHPHVKVIEIDYVLEGLRRTSVRLSESELQGEIGVSYLLANLEAGAEVSSFPLASGCVDAILGSLFLSYVSSPEKVLKECFRVLRPGGRIVLSTLRRDADMSKLYAEGVEEFKHARLGVRFGLRSYEEVETACRAYMNEASRLMDLEEEGTFRFWDALEFSKLMRRAGFRRIRTEPALGDPPQAVIVSAARP